MSIIDNTVGKARPAPKALDALDPSAFGMSGLDTVLGSIGAIFPEPLFIVDENDALVWMNLAMADRICRDNALEPDYAVEWLLSQIDDQDDDLMRDGHRVIPGAAPVRVIALSDVLGRPEWLTVQICEVPGTRATLRLIVLQDITPIKKDALALREENAILAHCLQHDLSTGLASRSAFESSLEAGRSNDSGALLVFEVADFRQLAAKHGVLAANRVLERLAADLVEMIDDAVLASRVAEDRLAILQGSAQAEGALAENAANIARAICSTHNFPSGRWSVCLRVACAMGPIGPHLLPLAEGHLARMEAPNDVDRIRVQVAASTATAIRARDSALQSSLKAAIDDNQLEAFFQPAVSSRDGQVLLIEALARWRHPENGLIPPPLFLSIARDAGLLPDIDQAVARAACVAAASWKSDGHDIVLSLNLSHALIRDPDARATLLQILAESGLPPGSVIFECGSFPTVALGDTLLLEGVRALRSAGLRFALDDAGGQHSDPTEIFLLRPDLLKVSPACVTLLTENGGAPAAQDEGSTASTARLHALRHYLSAATQVGADIAAVGVQDTAAARALTAAGFTCLQGHLIARPIPPRQLEEWLAGCDREASGGPRAHAAFSLFGTT